MNRRLKIASSVEIPESDRFDRRRNSRFPIKSAVEYRGLGKRDSEESGVGTTLNISSCGVMFTSSTILVPGRRLELSISWPVPLNGTCALKLVARGKVVRCEAGRTAFEIQQYEFRTQGSRVLPSVSDAKVYRQTA